MIEFPFWKRAVSEHRTSGLSLYAAAVLSSQQTKRCLQSSQQWLSFTHGEIAKVQCWQMVMRHPTSFVSVHEKMLPGMHWTWQCLAGTGALLSKAEEKRVLSSWSEEQAWISINRCSMTPSSWRNEQQLCTQQMTLLRSILQKMDTKGGSHL